jgi:hypothetical protein
MRIWDFYFVFPREAKNITMPRDLFSLKSTLGEPNPYEELVDAQRVFDRMRPFQLAAYKHLAAHGLIDSTELANNSITAGAKPIPNELLLTMKSLDSLQESVINIITGPLSTLPLNGPSGIKARTRLLDFKYDLR